MFYILTILCFLAGRKVKRYTFEAEHISRRKLSLLLTTFLSENFQSREQFKGCWNSLTGSLLEIVRNFQEETLGKTP